MAVVFVQFPPLDWSALFMPVLTKHLEINYLAYYVSCETRKPGIGATILSFGIDTALQESRHVLVHVDTALVATSTKLSGDLR